MSWPWLAIVETLWVVASALWIVSDRRAPTSTLAWILTLAFLPVVGIPVYILLGSRRLRRRRIRYEGLARKISEALQQLEAASDESPDVVRQMKLALRLDESP